MVGLNQDFKKVFVTTNNTLLPSGTTTALEQCQLGIFNADTYSATTTPDWSTAKTLIIAQGTPDLSYMPKGAGIPNQTDKSKVITGKTITGWRKKAYSAGQQQIVTIGYDGTDTDKTISGKCDEIKHIYLKLTGRPIEKLIPGGLIVHVQAQGPCCETCGDSCADVSGELFADEFISQLGQYRMLGGIPLSKFVLIEKIESGTSFGIKFTGAFVEHTTDTCYFDRFPYNADPIHIQVNEWDPNWHGDRCASTYPVTVIQDPEYPFGDGQYVIRYEAEAIGWDNRYYNKFDIFLRQAEAQYLCTDPSENYDKYTLSYSVHYHVLGYSQIYTDNYELEVFVKTGQTAFKTAINSYISSVTGLGIATV